MQRGGSLGGCTRRFVQQQIDFRKRRQAFLNPDLAHAANQRAAAEYGHRHAGESGRLQTSHAVADARDAPAQTRGLQLFDGMVAIDVARRQERQRDRRFVVRGRLLARHPYQLLLPHHLAAGEIVHAGHQGNVDFAALDAPDQRRRQRAIQFDLNPRKCGPEDPQNRRQHERRVEIRRAENDMSLDVRGGEMGQQLVVQPENGFGIIEHCLTLGGEKQPTALMDENGFASEFFEALQLKGDRRLAPAEEPRSLRYASGLDDRNQRAEHPNIQTDEVHFTALELKPGITPCKFHAAARSRQAIDWGGFWKSRRRTCPQNRLKRLHSAGFW